MNVRQVEIIKLRVYKLQKNCIWIIICSCRWLTLANEGGRYQHVPGSGMNMWRQQILSRPLKENLVKKNSWHVIQM